MENKDLKKKIRRVQIKAQFMNYLPSPRKDMSFEDFCQRYDTDDRDFYDRECLENEVFNSVLEELVDLLS